MLKITMLVLATVLSSISMADPFSHKCNSTYCPGDYLQVRGGGNCEGSISTCTFDGCVYNKYKGDILEQASCNNDVVHAGSRLEVLSRADSWTSSILVRVSYSKPGLKAAPISCEGFVQSDCVTKISP